MKFLSWPERPPADFYPMKFDVQDEQQHSDFLTPHALLHDKKRDIFWAALLRPNGLAVYIAILNHANYHSRKARPGEKLLAQETGLSKRQVEREIAKLKAFNMITVASPEDKKDLFDMPKRAKATNTYTLVDKKHWRIPDDYQDRYAKKKRNDKGKRLKTQQLDILIDTPATTAGTTVSRQGDDYQSVGGDDYQSVGIPTGSRPPTDYQSSPYRLPVVQSNIIEISPIEITPPTTTTKDKKNDGAVGGEINSIFSQKGRQEKITAGHIKRILSEHHLKSEDEIVRVVRFLAAQDFTFAGQPIGNMLGFLIGSKNDNGGHGSSCFFDGECLFPEPENPAQQENKPGGKIEPAGAHINWQAKFDALPEKDKTAIRAQSEKKISSHKAKMKPDVYAETLKLATFGVFQEWSRSTAAAAMAMK